MTSISRIRPCEWIPIQSRSKILAELQKASQDQQKSAKAAWQIFKRDPFDPRLRAHKIHRLSAALGKTVYAVEIERDLRVVFYLEENTVYTLDIGTHAIYRP